MRQIKFRAWDNDRKKMHTSPKWVEFSVNKQGELSAKNFNIKGNVQDLIIIQFTGLKDKNGVDIYEGDIVNDMFDCGQHYIISWVDNLACFVRTEILRPPIYSNSKPCIFTMNISPESVTKGEVIGNIYENPELMEGQHD